MRMRRKAIRRNVSCAFGFGWALVWLAAGAAATCCRAEAPTTNAFALKMHAIIVPEIHIRPPEGKVLQDPFGSITGVVCTVQTAVSNQNTFAIHARNLTMLELVDLICFLSDTTYAFGNGGLIVAPTNMPTVYLQQNAKREKAVIAKLKAITIPSMFFRPPATILDAIDFLYQASSDFDEPEIPVNRRGLNFAVKKPYLMPHKEVSKPKSDAPLVGLDHWGYSTLYDAVTQVCEKVDARFMIRDNTVVIYPAADGTGGRALPEGTGQ